MYNVGFIGEVMEVAEYLYHMPECELKTIIVEKDKFNDDILTYSLVRDIDVKPVSNIKDAYDAMLEAPEIDFYVMCCFGKKISEDIINYKDVYNVHLSSLPYYKSRHPIFWAMLNNEKEIGVSLHKVAAIIDQGEIVSQVSVTNYFGMSEDDIFNEMIAGVPILLNDLLLYINNQLEAKPNAGGYYYKPASIDDLTIDLNSDSLTDIFNKVMSQKRYRGMRLVIEDNIYWIKEIKFTRNDDNVSTGSLHLSKDKCLSVAYKNGISLKLVEYEKEG